VVKEGRILQSTAIILNHYGIPVFMIYINKRWQEKIRRCSNPHNVIILKIRTIVIRNIDLSYLTVNEPSLSD
jgi:hypothetical protein